MKELFLLWAILVLGVAILITVIGHNPFWAALVMSAVMVSFFGFAIVFIVLVIGLILKMFGGG